VAPACFLFDVQRHSPRPLRLHLHLQWESAILHGSVVLLAEGWQAASSISLAEDYLRDYPKDYSKDCPPPLDAASHATIVVFNLDPAITQEELRAVFSRAGEIKDIRETPNKRHHKFIEYFCIKSAEDAVRTLHKHHIQVRAVHVELTQKGKKVKVEISKPGGQRKYEEPPTEASSQNSSYSSVNGSAGSTSHLSLLSNSDVRSDVPLMSAASGRAELSQQVPLEDYSYGAPPTGMQVMSNGVRVLGLPVGYAQPMQVPSYGLCLSSHF
jgi:RNA recognition motif-containing protein